jgi:hypothetical protein
LTTRTGASIMGATPTDRRTAMAKEQAMTGTEAIAQAVDREQRVWSEELWLECALVQEIAGKQIVFLIYSFDRGPNAPHRVWRSALYVDGKARSGDILATRYKNTRGWAKVDRK